MWDVTFWEHCRYCGDADQALLKEIQAALFPVVSGDDNDKRALNRLCDALPMWCHISNQNEVFLTTDANFSKTTKLPQLLKLGAGRVCVPGEV